MDNETKLKILENYLTTPIYRSVLQLDKHEKTTAISQYLNRHIAIIVEEYAAYRNIAYEKLEEDLTDLLSGYGDDIVFSVQHEIPIIMNFPADQPLKDIKEFKYYFSFCQVQVIQVQSSAIEHYVIVFHIKNVFGIVIFVADSHYNDGDPYIKDVYYYQSMEELLQAHENFDIDGRKFIDRFNDFQKTL